MKRTAFSRRDFMRMGGSALLLPFLFPGKALAAAPGKATRLIIFHTPDGTYPAMWRPLNAPPPNMPLAAAPMFNQMHQNADFIKLADNLILMDGLSMNNVGAGHAGNALALTCGGPDSFDHFAANTLSAGSRVPSLNLRVLSAPGGSPFNDVTYSSGAVSSYLTSPMQAFNLLFSGMGTGAAATALKAQRSSILDAVQSQIAAVQKQLGSAETTKLAAHLSAVRSLEQSLNGGSGGSGGAQCAGPTPAADITDPHSYFTATGDAMVQLIALGVGCGITPVATLAWAGEAEDPLLWAADPTITSTDGYHGILSHRGGGSDPTAIAKLVKCEQWFCGEFAKLVNALKSTPDPAAPGQMVFDSTVVVWTRSMGEGAAHTNHSLPFIIAAGNNTGIKTAPGGRYLNYGGFEAFDPAATPPGLTGLTPYNGQAGEPHQRVFATLAQALGVPFTGFGVTAYPTPGNPMNPLAELV